MRPRIGITAYWRNASWGPWTDLPACLAPQAYVESIVVAGGFPLLLPPLPEITDFASEALASVDGLILVGGDDVDATQYGAEPHALADPPNKRRDAAELALLRGAVERDMPLLGICRGLQLLNIAYGGTLDQHLDDSVDGDVHRVKLGEWSNHAIEVVGGKLQGLVPSGTIIHSHHHQGIETVGAGLAVTAKAADGTIEGLEDPAKAFCVGVLWHPEEAHTGSGAPLFNALIDAAGSYAAAHRSSRSADVSIAAGHDFDSTFRQGIIST